MSFKLTNIEYIPQSARELFLEQFEKDLQFFQLIFLLFNRTSPIKNIDLMWAEDGPAGRVGLRRCFSTADALTGSCARFFGQHEQDGRGPRFCRLVNHNGKRESESCGLSDKAAEMRVRASGEPQVYRCDAGLIDIAVPVFINGQLVATLLTGQVLKEAHNAPELVQITETAKRLPWVDTDALAEAYWEVPIVTEEDIQNAIVLMQVFAEYLAASWARVMEIVAEQRNRGRELSIYNKEFAYAVLEGDSTDRTAVSHLLPRLGFARAPNRVLIVDLEIEEQYPGMAGSFDLAFAQALQAVEQICEKHQNASCAHLKSRGVTVFLADQTNQGRLSDSHARKVAQEILNGIASRCNLGTRVGIGGIKESWHELLESYHEAAMALQMTTGPIAVWRKPSASDEALSSLVENLLESVSKLRLTEARSRVVALPLVTTRHLGQVVAAQRQFFLFVIDSMLFACRIIGLSDACISSLRICANKRLETADAVFSLQEGFTHSAEKILEEVRWLYTGKREKVVDQVCRLVERELEDPQRAAKLSIDFLATSVGLSPDHMSRLFRREKGQTLERHLMVRRVEAAKRLLLDPLNNVSQVADRCGFSDPTYFARVFRKITGCSPTDFARAPLAIPHNLYHSNAFEGATPSRRNALKQEVVAGFRSTQARSSKVH